MSTQRSIALLGATGSIGASTLAVLRLHPERFRLTAVAARQQWQPLVDICCEFHPQVAALADAQAAAALRQALHARGCRTEVVAGEAATVALAADASCDTVVAAIVGAAGLPSVHAAVRAGKRVLLANKEALVATGALMMRTAAESGALLLPVDSEHNALFQCLTGSGDRSTVRRLILTASGGPFRARDASTFGRITPEEACAHPNWRMGRKISVDSATLMNKGLEVIEARWLFGLPASQIEVLVHPQSIVHGLVEYADGSVLAHLSCPDMRVPIVHALAWPERLASGVPWLDLIARATLTFEAPDVTRFPCLALAYRALEEEAVLPAVLNAANEVAVQAFLTGRLRFDRIPALIEETLAARPWSAPSSIEEALALDQAARVAASERLRHWELNSSLA